METGEASLYVQYITIVIIGQRYQATSDNGMLGKAGHDLSLRSNIHMNSHLPCLCHKFFLVAFVRADHPPLNNTSRR